MKVHADGLAGSATTRSRGLAATEAPWGAAGVSVGKPAPVLGSSAVPIPGGPVSRGVPRLEAVG